MAAPCGGWTTDSTVIETDDVIPLTDGSIEGVPGSLVPLKAEWVDERLSRVATQFRESPIFLGIAETYLGALVEPTAVARAIPCYFDLDTAVGNQLTMIGKWLGFPRCHCVCRTMPVFGVSYDQCGGEPPPGAFEIVGVCDEESSLIDCQDTVNSEICVRDDELYRRILYVRRYQYLSLFDYRSLTEAVRLMFGEQAFVVDRLDGSICVVPMRGLTSAEEAALPVIFRALPIAPGIIGLIHRGSRPIFGVGEGWSGPCDPVFDEECPPPFVVCDDGDDICAYPPLEPEECQYPFGVGDGYVGVCEDTELTISDVFCPEDPFTYQCAPN